MLGTGAQNFAQRSPHPIRKYVEKVASQDLDDYPDWDLTAQLPKLPIPELRRTMQNYLQSVQPIIRPEQYEYTRQLTEDFCQPGGVGERLQAKLKAIAETNDNWAYNYWLDDMYMRNRVPLPVNSNPGTVFPQQRFDNQDAQLRYAAKLISGILDYKMIIDCRGLPVDRVRHHERGQPLCMEQYYRLFTSYRVPELPKDRLLGTHPQDSLVIGMNSNNHVIVAHKNQFFVLNVIVNHVRLSDDNILTQLKRITKMAENPTDNGVGLLTAGHRDLWAEARQLLRQDERNKANLDLIENCIFVLCLDKPVPFTLNPSKPTGRDSVSLAHQMLHGQGCKLNTPNRWFDKTMQFIIGADGAVGLCYEHSPSEGIAVIDLIEHLLKYLVEREKKLLRMQSLSELPYPKKLEWFISPQVDDIRNRVAQETDSLISDLSLYILNFAEYGREFPKSQNMSPDSYIQLALQLTYYKVHGCLVSTYESASLRRFRLGRVDNIRACTMEALEFAKAMVGELLCSSQDKVRLLRKAIKKQTEILLQTILGFGFDNHLLGLRELASEEGIMPELFRDDTYRIGHKFALSTSQVPTKMENTFMCYGPVVPDGYGACYNPQPNSIIVCVSSFRSCSVTDSERFALALRDTLLEMRDLCLQAASTADLAMKPTRVDVVVNGITDVSIAS